MQADCMTSDQLAKFREHVRAKLLAEVNSKGEPVMYQFPAETLAAAGAGDANLVPPFAVMGSDDVDMSVGR